MLGNGSLLPLCSLTREIRLLFCVPLALHYIGFAQDRLRLGNKIKKLRLLFCIPLALHYLCGGIVPMNNMSREIRHVGVVDAVEGDCVRVRIQQEAACGSCRLSSRCRSADSKERIVEVCGVTDTGSYAPGDNVVVTASAGMAATALLYGFGLPLAVMAAALVAAYALTRSETTAAVTAIVALVPYYAALYLLRGRMRDKMAFGIERRE